MTIEMMPIGAIKPYEKNPRKNEQAVDMVAQSIQEFGWQAPIVVDSDHVIICGHTRMKAALKLGLSEVPVHVAENLSPEQVKAFRIADNKSSELAEWDYSLLPAELQSLCDAGYDVELTGFTLDDLATMGDDQSPTDGATDPNAVPEPPKEPVSKLGECYQLGNHRLCCGDSTSAEAMDALMGEEKAQLYLVDPPYGVAIENSQGMTIMNDNLKGAAFKTLLLGAFQQAARVLEPGCPFYIFHADIEAVNFRLAAQDAELEVHQSLYWVKDRFVLGRLDYHYQTEPILYGWLPGAAHRWYSDRKQTNVLHCARPTKDSDHPSMKPVELIEYLLSNSSKRGDVVLDNFGGSGSTLLACERLGRRARLMELDPKYCDVIRRRWAEFIHGEGCDWASCTPQVNQG